MIGGLFNMKIKTIGLLALLTLGCSSMVLGQAVTISLTDDGVFDDSVLHTDQEISFWVNIAAGPENINGLTNGIRVYSTDGATWTTVTTVTTDAITKADNFDLFWNVKLRSVTGTGADTVKIQGSVMENPIGMPSGFDDTTHMITIGPIPESSAGCHICFDSCFVPPSTAWLWVQSNGENAIPSWGGPYCYLVDPSSDVSSRNLSSLPDEWSLGQNYPNPFNPTTEVAFDVKTRSHVTLAVYNVLGQHVTNLVDETLSPGSYTADWDGTAAGGNTVSSGVYFYRLETEEFVATRKMMLLK